MRVEQSLVSLKHERLSSCACISSLFALEPIKLIFMWWSSWFHFLSALFHASNCFFFEGETSFVLSGIKYLLFGSEEPLLWWSCKKNSTANNKPSQGFTANTNKAQRSSEELKVLQCKTPPASLLLVKQQHPDAWINAATNNCNVSDCERCPALPDAL